MTRRGVAVPYPDPPEDVQVNAVEADKLSVCWKPPLPQDSNRHLPVKQYTVFYKQIPNFPFLGGGEELVSGSDGEICSSPLGGIPLLTEDYSDTAETTDDYAELEHSQSSTDGSRLEVRRRRQSWIFVTHDPSTNSSTVREFKFSEVCRHSSRIKVSGEHDGYLRDSVGPALGHSLLGIRDQRERLWEERPLGQSHCLHQRATVQLQRHSSRRET